MTTGEEKSSFRDVALGAINKNKSVLAVLIFLVGIGLRYFVSSLHLSKAVSGVLDDLGGLLIGSVTFTYVYEIFIKADEKAIFLADMKAILSGMKREEREEFRADLLIMLRAERKGQQLVIYNSRPPLNDKVEVIKTATESVIEIGTALHTYVNYLTTASDKQYKNHIVDLLGKHVAFKCVMMKADVARHTHPENPNMYSKISASRAELIKIKKELDPIGDFQILEYCHMPYFAAICVDGDTPHGQMFVTPYLYNAKNADAPSFLISRADQPVLFEQYWESAKAIIASATPIH